MACRRKYILVIAAVALVASVAPPLTGSAGAGPVLTVTLKAQPQKLTFGEKTTLSGAIDPPTPGETVNILDGQGTVRQTTVTDEEGRYSVKLAPDANVELHAQWLAAVSEPVKVKVAPLIRLRLSRTDLFRSAVVTGPIKPSGPSDKVKVKVFRNGRPALKREVSVRDGGRFSTAFRVNSPGAFRAVALFNDADHLQGRGGSELRRTLLPSLSSGSDSRFVRTLEKRLRELNHKMPGVNNFYDSRTADAVVAFHKLQGMPRSFSVTEATWRALADPIRATPRDASRDFHIEVDQTKQLLYLVEDGKVAKILHVSTGAGSATRDGTFHVYRKLEGYSPNRLYYPSYFDGLRALHGWPEVPTYNASHGCVRLPMWSAQWVYGEADLDTRILIYH